jgi:hypothetical protein
MTAMRAKRSYTEVSTEAFQLDDFRIQPARLNHPQGCLVLPHREQREIGGFRHR